MSNTVGILRNLLALRGSRSAFSLKYCTSRNGNTDFDKESFLWGDKTGKGYRGVGNRRFHDGTPRQGTKIADLGSSGKGNSSSIQKSPPLSGEDNVTVPVKNGAKKDAAGKKSDASTFAAMLRSSPLIDLGDPLGKLVIGTIYKIVKGSAYIDFGWKFPAVCSLPEGTQHVYKLGCKVVLQINDLELSTRFLGDTAYTSLLEADCNLICPYELNITVETGNPILNIISSS